MLNAIIFKYSFNHFEMMMAMYLNIITITRCHNPRLCSFAEVEFLINLSKSIKFQYQVQVLLIYFMDVLLNSWIFDVLLIYWSIYIKIIEVPIL